MIEKTTLTLTSSLYQKKATFFHNNTIQTKGCLLYFHGGGLFFGHRNDLPALHLETLTSRGYCILTFDYPLAPEAQIKEILEDVSASVNYYIHDFDLIDTSTLPYFLWGRSAGAYLILLTAGKSTFDKSPSGILSFYGYGLLTDSWYNEPSKSYLQLPLIKRESLLSSDKITGYKNVEKYFGYYIHARQTGNWTSLFFNGRDKDLFINYSLRLVDTFDTPLFCTHATGDSDVPYSEFLALMQKYHPTTHIVSSDIHDFDRLEEKSATSKLLEATLQFLIHNS